MSQSFLPEVKVVKDYVEDGKEPEEPFVADSVTNGEVEDDEDDQEVIQQVIKEMAKPPNGVKKVKPEPIDNIFEEPVKLTKAGKPRKKRRPLTEDEKERLAKARDKATEARRRKAAEKREALELEKKEKELLKKQRKKKLEDLEKSLDSETKKDEKVETKEEKVETETTHKINEMAKPPNGVKTVKEKPTATQGLFSQTQLDEAVMNGIIGYEKIRKERKAKKKEEQAKAQEQQKVRDTLQRAIAPKPYNPYAFCY